MRKILLQILIFGAIFIVIFNITRFFMHLDFIPQNADKIELLKMYLLGTYHDIRFLSVVFLPLLLCGFLSYFTPLLKTKKSLKLYFIFSGLYISLIAILSLSFSFIKYYYYEMYKSKIDIFIFSVLNENFSTIFSIIYKDYPLLSGIFALILMSLFCFFLNNKILKISLKPLKLKATIFILCHLILIGIYILALRGYS